MTAWIFDLDFLLAPLLFKGLSYSSFIVIDVRKLVESLVIRYLITTKEKLLLASLGNLCGNCLKDFRGIVWPILVLRYFPPLVGFSRILGNIYLVDELRMIS